MPGRYSPGVLPYAGPRRPSVADALQEGLNAYAQMQDQQRNERNQMLMAGGVELPSDSPAQRIMGALGGRVGGLLNRVTGRTTIPETDPASLQQANAYSTNLDVSRTKNIPAEQPTPFVPAAMETPPGGVRPGVGLPSGIGTGFGVGGFGVDGPIGTARDPGFNPALRPTPGFNPRASAPPQAAPQASYPGVAQELGAMLGTSGTAQGSPSGAASGAAAPDGTPRGGYVLRGRGGARYAFDPQGEAARAQATHLAELDAQEGIKNRYATALETAKAAAAATAAEKARQETFGQQTALERMRAGSAQGIATMHETGEDRRKRLDLEAKANAPNPQHANRLLTAFDNDPSFKNAQQIAQSLSQLRAAARDPSAAGDIAVLTHYMKMIDPTSSVREGEFANAQNAASIPGQVRNTYNKIVTGQRLTPETRADFVRQAEGLADSQRQVFKGTVNRYSTMAQRAGVDPRDVVFDPYSTLDEPGAAGAGAASRGPSAETTADLIRKHPNASDAEIAAMLRAGGGR